MTIEMAMNYRQSMMPDLNSVLRAIYSGAEKQDSMSFGKWVERTQRTREALLENRRQHEEELNEMSGTWARRIIDDKKTTFKIEESELAEIARKKVLEDLENVIQAKQAQYDRAMGAPSSDQINLIKVLQMRQEIGEDLTSSDFAGAVGHLADNFHALKMLQNLADHAGVAFPNIHDDFNRDIETVRTAANNILRSIDSDGKDLKYMDLLFWTTGSAGLNQNVFSKLDSLAYLSTTAEAVENAAIEKAIEKSKQSQPDGNDSPEFCSKVKLTGNETLSALADQFHVTPAQIRELNPLANLESLSRGFELYIPSTRYSFAPGNPSRAQPSQVSVAKRPVYPDPVGPNGETVGDDIVVSAV